MKQGASANPIEKLAYQRPFRPSLEAFCKARGMLAQTHLPQDTHADLFFDSSRSHFAGISAQQGTSANPHKGCPQEPFRTLPEGLFARHWVCSHKHRCRKIPMLIWFFGSNRNHSAGIPTQQRALANPPKGLAFKRPS